VYLGSSAETRPASKIEKRVIAEPASKAAPAAAAAARAEQGRGEDASNGGDARDLAVSLGLALLVGLPGQPHPRLHHLLGDDLCGLGHHGQAGDRLVFRQRGADQAEATKFPS
jgi:hypothetical protein